MQVNITNTNGIVSVLRAQRNDALDKVAVANGQIAELQEALVAAKKEIEKLKVELEARKAQPDDVVAEVA